MEDKKVRCGWCLGHSIYIDYHDREWGVPVWDDRELFELLILEGAQAGLNWITILKKRKNYRAAFDNFVPEKVAAYDEKKIASLLQNPGIIRNKLKIRAAVSNAIAFLKVQEEFGSFKDYIWKFVGGSPLTNSWKSLEEVPALTAESQQMSKQLKKRGFKFVGPTICYAFMQSTGMVNDHITKCFRWREIKNKYESV